MNKFKKYFDNENYQNGLRVVIICVFSVILVVGVNLLCGLIPTKAANYDISTEKVYSISRDTEKSLSELTEQVELYYVCEDGQEYHNTEVLLNLYADASPNISVEKIDPAYNPALIAGFTGSTSLENNSVIVVSGDRRQIVHFSDYYTSGVFVLEDYLNSAISYTVSDELLKAYSIAGHDEQKIHSSTIAYMGLDGFSCEDLNLIQEGEIPEDASLIIINGIQKDITEKESEVLLEYLKQGGNLLLITDYTTSQLKNLSAVTEYFGAAMGNGLIMESDSQRYTDDNPAYILPSILAGDYTLTDGINYMLLPNTKPIIIDQDTKNVKSTSLLQTSDAAFAVSNNIFTNETTSVDGPFTVGASFERGTDGKEGKMVWVTSKYVSDVSVSERIGGGNITFFLNSVCWLGKDNPVESVHAKKISTQYLNISTEALAIYRIVMMGVLPIIVLAAGIIVCIRRKRR